MKNKIYATLALEAYIFCPPLLLCAVSTVLMLCPLPLLGPFQQTMKVIAKIFFALGVFAIGLRALKMMTEQFSPHSTIYMLTAIGGGAVEVLRSEDKQTYTIRSRDDDKYPGVEGVGTSCKAAWTNYCYALMSAMEDGK